MRHLALLVWVISTFAVASSKNQLRIDGFNLVPGRIVALEADSCDGLISVFGNCFGNNPIAPYLMGLIPQPPEEFKEIHYPTSTYLKDVDPNLSLTYRLKEDEAIVLVGETPPRAAYFGVQSYLFTRYGKAQDSNHLPPELASIVYAPAPNPERFMQFASLGSSVNNVVIAKQLNAPHGFKKKIYFLSSASSDTVRSLKAALKKDGISDSSIFVEPLPKFLQLGLESQADELSFMIRYSIPEDDAAGDKWRQAPTLQLYRVTPKKSQTTKRFDNPVPLSRPGNSERVLFASLSELTEVVKEKTGGDPTHFLTAYNLGLTGQSCIEKKINCLGDTRDTDSYRIGLVGELGEKDVVVAIGVNHTLTGNATYQSLSINRTKILKGVGGPSQTGSSAGFTVGDFNGSVAKYFDAFPAKISPLLRQQQDRLYIQLFARDCKGLPVCTTLPNEVGLDESVNLVQRAYLLPGSTEGADPLKMLRPRLLVWRGR